MKKKHGIMLLSVLLMTFAFLSLSGCSSDTSAEGIVKTELNLIQKLDEETISSFVSYEDMMHTQSASTDIGSETTEAVQLFFENFDYKILSSSSTDKTATVNVQITNVDAKALAKDLCRTVIARTVTPGSAKELSSMSSYFTLLRDILKENTYEMVTTTAHFELVNSENGWSIQASEALEDELVGGFISYLHDENLIPPEEVVSLTLDALKSLTPDGWVAYLGMEDIFETYNQLGANIDLALARQISEHFDYTVKEARVTESEAQVDVEVVSLDLEKVLSVYLDELLDYASTTEAVRATDSELSDKTSQLLLDCLNQNSDVISQTVTLNLINNGYNWEIQLDDTFTNALLGNLSEAMETFQTSALQ